MDRRSSATFALATLLLLPAAIGAQQVRPQLPEDATRLVGAGFQYDAARSGEDLETTRASLRALLPEWMLEGDNLSVRVYRFDGDLEAARRSLRLTDAFPATSVQTRPLGQGLQALLGMFEELAREMYGDVWLERARREIPRLNQVRQQTFEVTGSDEPAPDGKGMIRGRTITLSGSSPYLAPRSLEVVDGTWLHLVEIRYALSEARMRELMAEEEADSDEGFEGAWDEEAATPTPEEIGAPFYPGLKYFDTSDLMSPPRGATFAVQATFDEVVDFYLGSEGLYCEEGYAYRPDQGERADGYGSSVELSCLDHPGEAVDEDEGLEIQIQEPDREVREVVESMTGLWVPQNTIWVSFFRWDRELY